ncbi:MAG: hypothetical protein AAB229_09455 [Candidatus Hydrogenedentota bacterium]
MKDIAGVQHVPARPMLFLLSMSYSLAGIIASKILALQFIGALGVAMTALGLVELTREFFARHRDISWNPDAGTPYAASTELVVNLMTVLFGIVAAFFLFAVTIRKSVVLDLFSFQINGVFFNKLIYYGLPFGEMFGKAFLSGVVLTGISFFLAAIYKEAGMALILSWTGSLWGIAMAILIRHGGMGASAALQSLLIVDPENFARASLLLVALAAQSVAFINSGMTGLFLARGALKYSLRSSQFRAVAHTSLRLFGAALGFLMCAAALTAYAISRDGG